jgi:putative membrane protein
MAHRTVFKLYYVLEYDDSYFQTSFLNNLMRILPMVGLILGLLIFVVLILWQGIDDIFDLLATSGWELLALPIVWFPCLIAATISWRMLFPKKHTPKFVAVFKALWIGRAINTLLPVATIGGEIAKARLITLWGTSGVDASASVLVDKTVQAMAVAVWAFTGTLLLIYLALDNELAIAAMLGITALAGGLLGFILVQHAGMVGFMAKAVGKFVSSDGWEEITNNAKAVDALVLITYKDYRNIIISTLWRTFGLVLQTSEVWLACYLLGFPISIIEALMLKSLTTTISDIAFFIPNAYGVQEGGYVMLGALLGMTPEFALAVSLATRIRELLVDIPGLLVWQHFEGKLLLKKRDNIN